MKMQEKQHIPGKLNAQSSILHRRQQW